MFEYFKMQPRIGEAIESLLDGIGQIGNVGPNNGWTRLAFSAEENEVHNYAGDKLRQHGFDVRVDALGNLFGRKGDRDEPAVMIGTHLDTVPNGGNFDGVVGFIVGLLGVLEAEAKQPLPVPVELVVFRAEESTRFRKACLGSRIAFGDFSSRQYNELTYDEAGEQVSLKQAIERCGFSELDQDDELSAKNYLGYLETHIEQARVLETYNQLGIVESIRAPERRKFTIEGPRAVKAACAMIRTVEWICERYSWLDADIVGTVGKVDGFFLSTQPKARLSKEHHLDRINAIPGRAIFHVEELERNKYRELSAIAEGNGISVDFGENESPYGAHVSMEGITDHSGGTPMGKAYRRDALVAAATAVLGLPDNAIRPSSIISIYVDLRSKDANTRTRVSSEIVKQFHELADEFGVKITKSEVTEVTEPVPELDGGIQHRIYNAANQEHIGVRKLPSGAGHDALFAAQAGIPTGMIFVPSKDGLSHNPKEFTATEDIAKAIAIQARILSDWKASAAAL